LEVSTPICIAASLIGTNPPPRLREEARLLFVQVPFRRSNKGLSGAMAAAKICDKHVLFAAAPTMLSDFSQNHQTWVVQIITIKNNVLRHKIFWHGGCKPYGRNGE
jgi:hypothetical protein